MSLQKSHQYGTLSNLATISLLRYNIDVVFFEGKAIKRFLIKREMPGIGAAPKNDLNNAAKGSEEVLEALRAEGKSIQQEQSCVIGDAIFLST